MSGVSLLHRSPGLLGYARPTPAPLHAADASTLAQTRVRTVRRTRDRGLQGLGTATRAVVDRRRGRGGAAERSADDAHGDGVVGGGRPHHLAAPATADVSDVASPPAEDADGVPPPRALGAGAELHARSRATRRRRGTRARGRCGGG